MHCPIALADKMSVFDDVRRYFWSVETISGCDGSPAVKVTRKLSAYANSVTARQVPLLLPTYLALHFRFDAGPKHFFIQLINLPNVSGLPVGFFFPVQRIYDFS